MKRKSPKSSRSSKVRYAVIGLGHIAQAAVLPAFQHAKKNSLLKALVSGDPTKLKHLGKKYNVSQLYSYSKLEECFRSGEIDAVYIATPNDLHQKFVEMATRYGIHVLCEKPLAVDEASAFSMLEASQMNKVKLMTAYRLHFDPANLRAIEWAKSGKLGDLKIFNSIFTMQVRDRNNIRLDRARGGGPLHDIGIYCINAARHLFRDEPEDVFALSSSSNQARFQEVDECMTAIMRFPKDRVATFTISFGAADSSDFDLIGSKARLHLENAYEYAAGMKLHFYKDGRSTTRSYKKHDQFAPELLYFSNCILRDKEPEPSALEGIADLKIIDALLESRRIGSPVHLSTTLKRNSHPSLKLAMTRPPVEKQKEIHASSPSGQ